MPVVISNLSRSGQGRPLKYNWPEWSDGQARRFTKGTDFDSSTTTFVAGARNYAKTRGLKVSTRTLDPETVELEFSNVSDLDDPPKVLREEESPTLVEVREPVAA